MTHFLTPLLARTPGPLHLMRTGHTTPVATTLEGAFDSRTRKKGLLDRKGLAPGAALVIAPCGAIHTFGMRFAIDVIFCAKDGRVLKVARHIAPRRIAVCLRAFTAIEVSAGAADAVRVGDFLSVSARSPPAPTRP